MNIWFLIWVFISCLIMGLFFWSVLILARQKGAWKRFAADTGMQYFPNGLMTTAVVKGEYDGVPVSVISEPQMDEDHRGQRFRTVIQFTIGKGMPAEGVIGSQSMRDFVTDLPFSEEFVLEADKWNEHSIIRTDDAAALDSYFTPQRVVALNALMSIKGVNVIYVFNRKDALLRLESPDPFDDETKLKRFIAKVVDAAKIIAPE